MPTWLIVGASRGIGLEFVRQLLVRGDKVIATVRNPTQASELWALLNVSPPGACRLLLCDVASDEFITNFISEITTFRLPRIDYVVMNAGILHYPNRATEVSFFDFYDHMRTNCIGPIIAAQRLLKTNIDIGAIIFMSSDSGSATSFLSYEDGFAAYAASKAALNQALRHMAAELDRTASATTILAMHPGEVSTYVHLLQRYVNTRLLMRTRDMQQIDIAWEIDGLLSPEESIRGMLGVIEKRERGDSGTFWTWEGKVRQCPGDVSWRKD